MTTARGLLQGLRLPVGWEAELYVETGDDRDIGWADGRPKDCQVTRSSGAALRVGRDGRRGFASGTDVSPEGVDRLWERARAAAELTPRDSARRLPGPARISAGRAPSPDRALLQAPVALLERRLAALEKNLLKSDRRVRRALSLSFSETRGEWAVVSTRGVGVAQPVGSVSFGLELLGESRGDTQVAWGSGEKIRWDRLEVRAIAADVRQRLLDSFGAEPLSTGRWPVVFEPRVGVDLWELLSQAVAGDAVQKGRSFLGTKLGKPVGSSRVTIRDDGRLPGGLASGPADAEGVPTQTTTVIDNGTLRGFLHDTESAARAGTASTGNADRSGFAGPPGPGTTNFYLAPGQGSAAQLLKETPRAFVVRDLIGMHTADPVSGDFSVGAAGVLWEKGRVRRAVKGVTLAGNLLDLMAKIDAVADDLTWQGAYGSPTFRVTGLSIGGSEKNI